MAGDRRATAGNVIVTDRVEKIIEVDSTSLLAVAGVPATAFEMARVLQTSFEYYRRSQLQPLSLPARVRALARLLRDNLPMTLQGIGVVVPLFAGVDHGVSPPQARIYFYDPLGAQFQAVGYAASGSGSGTIRSVLSFQERHGSRQAVANEFAGSGAVCAGPPDHGVGIRCRHRRGQPGRRNLRHHQSCSNPPAWKPSPTSNKRSFCMTEEPYRWLEAMANRREYVRDQLKGGSPVFAASLPDGILLLGVGGGQSKVFELFDRHALAGLGHPADIEKVRQAAIDAAHLEAFTRAAEDVSLRRLIGFGLSPQLKTQFDQIFSAPFLVELLLAELGAEPGQDLLFRLHFDGAFQVQSGGAVMAASQPEAESAGQSWLNETLRDKTSRPEVVDLLLQAWWCQAQNKWLAESVPDAAQRQAGWREAVRGKTVEIGWLARHGPAPRPLPAANPVRSGLVNWE